MNHALHSLVDLAETLSGFDTIIDVRSPSEFADDHLPGAVNVPVLDDAQRAEVGTLYKQVSPFAARRIGAAMVSENIAAALRQQFHDRPKTWHPLIYCWRGGQRSGSMTTVFRQIGWNAQQLDGGYKAYRRHVIERLAALPPRLSYRVVGGPTGSAKSRILQALAARGAQVLDLEELARHKGSVLGVLPANPQPSQKCFESELLQALHALDPARPVYVEAESRRIGVLQVPDTLIESMRASPCITIDAAFDARVDFLLRDYAYFLADADWLVTRLEALRGLRGNEPVAHWIDLVRTQRWREFVADILHDHYDPLYRSSQNRNYRGWVDSRTIAARDLSSGGIDDVAERLLAAGGECQAAATAVAENAS